MLYYKCISRYYYISDYKMVIYMLKKIIAAAAAVLLAAAASGCSNNTNPSGTVDHGELSVTFFDVGKADSILLRTENSTVIIDCGEKGDGKQLVSTLSEQEIDTVDYLIITHYDKDHVGGAAKVIKDLDVKNVLAPVYDEKSDEVKKYNKALAGKNLSPQLLTSDISFELDGVKYTVYAPKQTDYGEGNDNDFSLVTKAVHGENTLLFTGDAMEARLDEIMEIGQCTFLKLPYHGRKLDNLGEFLDAVKPKCAVACTDISEFASSTQKALKERNIKYYATCYNGQINLVSSGKEISVTTEK